MNRANKALPEPAPGPASTPRLPAAMAEACALRPHRSKCLISVFLT